MKFLKNDVVLLLGFLLMFCFGLSFLRYDKQDLFFEVSNFDLEQEKQGKGVQQLAHVKEFSQARLRNNRQIAVDRKQEQLTQLSTSDLLGYMKPLFMTKSSSSIISFLQHIPVSTVYQVVEAIVYDVAIRLPDRVKMRVIFAGAQRQKNNKDKDQFFDLFVKNKRLQKGAKPLLVKAVEAGYAHLVPDIIHWAERSKVENVVRDSLLYAARHDDEDPDALRELYEAGVPFTPLLASELLYELAVSCSDGFSIDFLVNTVGADPNHVVSNLAVMMYAIKDHKISLVVELLNHGANPETKYAGEFGHIALQIASDRQCLKMEELLSKYSDA